MGEAKTFHYLNQSNCIDLNGFDDSKEYIETRRAMGIVGMSNDEQVRPISPATSLVHQQGRNSFFYIQFDISFRMQYSKL